MDHHALMVGMMWGGALVALVPTLLVVGVGIYVVRQERERRRAREAGLHPDEEV